MRVLAAKSNGHCKSPPCLYAHAFTMTTRLHPCARTHAPSAPPRSGGSVSGALIERAPCPCLTVPYKAMGLGEGHTFDEEDAMSPRASAANDASP